MFKITDHKLVHHANSRPVSFAKTPNQSGGFRPEGIVVHDTAGRLRPGSSVSWMQNPRAKASAHLVIERDGTVVQMVDFNRRAWHAGKSKFRGRKNVNAFAFGIEIVNPGKMTPRDNDTVGVAWYGEKFNDLDYRGPSDPAQHDLQRMRTAEHGDAMWMHYTPEQIDAVILVCSALVDEYECEWITTHWHISPGRKVDTNPLFPLESVRSRVFGREEDAVTTAPGPKGPEVSFGDAEVITATNMRRWPSYADNIIEVLPKLSRVDVIRSGHFPTGDCQVSEKWHLCDTGKNEGWVNAMLVDLD